MDGLQKRDSNNKYTSLADDSWLSKDYISNSMLDSPSSSLLLGKKTQDCVKTILDILAKHKTSTEWDSLRAKKGKESKCRFCALSILVS